MTNNDSNVSKATPAHTLVEDLLAFLTGAIFAALGVQFLVNAGLITGGTVGMALLAGGLSGWPFPWVYLLINLPFFIFGLVIGGWRYIVRSVVAVLLVSVASRGLPLVIEIGRADAAVSSLVGGLLVGVGMLIVIRHGGSLGGLNILSLYLQERIGVSAGKTQLTVDTTIIGLSALLLSAGNALLSILSVVAINIVLITNHKAGRYSGY
ncbi:MAG: YitT family protein [Gammaproteobacteria bacterium]|nr:MAG: YitT family protein [Gammaproteobacteria bacterium]